MPGGMPGGMQDMSSMTPEQRSQMEEMLRGMGGGGGGMPTNAPTSTESEPPVTEPNIEEVD